MIYEVVIDNRDFNGGKSGYYDDGDWRIQQNLTK